MWKPLPLLKMIVKVKYVYIYQAITLTKAHIFQKGPSGANIVKIESQYKTC